VLAAGHLYRRREIVANVERCCVALRDDLTEPECGVNTRFAEPMGSVWHAAVSLSFSARAVTRRCVGGTVAVLALAQRLGVREFTHVSTAYVSGRQTGTILERPVTDPSAANIPYEGSKILAEVEVLRQHAFMTRVVRRGILIDHSQTLADVGLYAAVAGAVEYRWAGVEETLNGRALRSPGDPSAPVNLIPIDLVALNIWAFSTHATAFSVHIFQGIDRST
jgi:nucleoside-diphosphate-sugar epimerase